MSEDERAGVEPHRRETAVAWAIVAVVLREVADALVGYDEAEA